MVTSVNNVTTSTEPGLTTTPLRDPFFSTIKLDPPSTTCPEVERLKAISVNGTTLNQNLVELLTNECESNMKEIHQLQKNKLEALKDQAEISSRSSLWNTVQTIASYIISALSILGGVLCLSTSPLSASICIAIGVLSLANNIFSQLDGYDWIAEKLSNGDKEKEIRLKTILPTIVGILLTGANLGSAAFIGVQQGVGLMQLIAQQSSKLAQGALLAPNFIQGGSQAMKGIYDAKGLLKDRDLERLSFELQKMKQSVDYSTKESVDDTKKTNSIREMLGQLVDLKLAQEGYILRLNNN